MKLNQELIKRLADGEIAYMHTGTDDQWEQIKKACDFKNHLPFCKEIETPIYCTKKTKDNYFEYYVLEENPIRTRPVFTTQQLFEVETEIKQTMDNETRELAKQLFVAYAGCVDGSMDIAIKDAKEFIKKLNEINL